MNFDTGSTGFMLVATSLVMLMTPGLAFFYGGLVGTQAHLDDHDTELRLAGLDDGRCGSCRAATRCASAEAS
jgi:hypothetical protein